MKNNSYRGYIFTNHAIDRLKNRGINKDHTIQTIKNPDKYYESKRDGSLKSSKKKKKLMTII